MDVFGALADPTRRDLIRVLARGGEATQSALRADVGSAMTRQALAKHLDTLYAAGLVIRERAGRETRYRLEPAPLGVAAAWIADVGSEWDDRLARLAKLLG
jgi:DNA-binding transcriptional ArsR family regulator